MNSVIISSLRAFGARIAEWFRSSAIGRAFFYVCAAVSGSWQNSSIMTFLRRDERVYADKSAAVRAMKCPFTFLDFVKRKIGAFIEENIKTSLLCRWARIYINNFIAVNTRFFGIMLVCAGLTYAALKLAGGHGIVLSGVIAAAAGVLLDFIKSCAGYKGLDLEAYAENETSGVTRLILAAVIGAVTGAGLGAAGIIAAFVPFALFGLTLVMYAPVTGVFAALFAAPFLPTMALAGLCLWTLLSLVIKSVTKENFRWKFDMVGAGILLLLAVLFVSSALSFSAAGSLKIWALYFVFLTFYFVIINSVENKDQLEGLLKLFVISGALVALYGVAQYLFGWTTANAWIDEEMFEDSTMRVYSTLGNPNVLGEYLLLVLPVAAGWFLKFKAGEWAKWAYLAMLAVLALCLVLTQSRGCWIGFMLSVFVFVTFYNGKLWGLIPIALCIIPFIIPQTMAERFMSIGNMEDSSTSYRVFIWLGTLGMLKHYWLGGIGMGEAAFNEVYPFFSYNAIQAPHSHNLFLQLTVEAGIPALIVFLATMVIFIKKLSLVYNPRERQSAETLMPLAIGSGIIGFLVQSMFDYTFYNYRVMAVFFMIIAAGMCFSHLKKEAADI